jgi:ABC-type phosphate transport system substrate-binding protein
MRLLNRAAIVAALGAATLLAATPSAIADPVNSALAPVTPAATDIVAVGSDTTEHPLNEISVAFNAKTPAPTNKFYSWDATPAGNITTKTGATVIARPNGSNQGIAALIANTSATVDFARSSRGRIGTDPAKVNGGIGFVAFARDAVAIASVPGGSVPNNLQVADLKALYECTATGALAALGLKPHLPQSGSGTRSFFLSAIGVTTPGGCVTSGVQENDGTPAVLNDPKVLVPYSVSKYIAQADHSVTCPAPPPIVAGKNLFGCNKTGPLALNSIDFDASAGVNIIAPLSGVSPNRTINTSYVSTAFGRTVYNVVRIPAAPAPVAIPTYLVPLLGTNGAGGYICSPAGTTLLQNHGLLTTPLCGIMS